MSRRTKGPCIQTIKAAVRKRDGHKCTQCGLSNTDHKKQTGRNLDVHRVTPGTKYAVETCITVCRSCHGGLPKRPRSQPDYAKGLVLRLPDHILSRLTALAELKDLDVQSMACVLLAICIPECEQKVELGLGVCDYLPPPKHYRPPKRVAGMYELPPPKPTSSMDVHSAS